MNEVLFMESVTVADVIIRAFIAIGAIIVGISVLVDDIKAKKARKEWDKFYKEEN